MVKENLGVYVAGLRQALLELDRAAVWSVTRELMRAWREHRQVFLVGNGGSSATASHMINDLNKLVVPGQPRFRAIALTDNVPLITAWGNDASYDRVFAEQLLNLCQPGDVLVAISCSGNSPNVLAAVDVACSIGARTIAFTGDVGGRLKDMVDLCVFTGTPDIGQQEDVHLALNHMIISTLRRWITSIAEREAQPLRALVLAAGEGTRLRPLTLDRPKPMLPVDGKPLLQHTLEWLKRQGVSEVAINLHHCPQAIVDHFGDGSAVELQITYSYEEQMLGTAGAVRKLQQFSSRGPLAVVYGDVLTDLDLRALLAFHRQAAALDPSTAATLALYHVSNPTEVGLVGMDESGRINRFVEKPKPSEVFTDLANAGVLILEPRVVDLIPPDAFYDFGHDLFPRLLKLGQSLYGWVVPGQDYLVDIGTPENYARAQREWPDRMAAHAEARVAPRHHETEPVQDATGWLEPV